MPICRASSAHLGEGAVRLSACTTTHRDAIRRLGTAIGYRDVRRDPFEVGLSRWRKSRWMFVTAFWLGIGILRPTQCDHAIARYGDWIEQVRE